jgi:release factor glutamine methyltransferase
MVYEPREDSFLLLEEIKKRIRPGMKALDVGTGSGLLAKAMALEGAEAFALDIDRGAIRQAKEHAENVCFFLSDLLSAVKGRFDLIAFNPPYLPGKEKDLETVGGPEGHETVLRFIEQLPSRLKRSGECLLLISSHTNPGKVEKAMKEEGLGFKVVSRSSMFFEELMVYSIKPQLSGQKK